MLYTQRECVQSGRGVGRKTNTDVTPSIVNIFVQSTAASHYFQHQHLGSANYYLCVLYQKSVIIATKCFGVELYPEHCWSEQPLTLPKHLDTAKTLIVHQNTKKDLSALASCVWEGGETKTSRCGM